MKLRHLRSCALSVLAMLSAANAAAAAPRARDLGVPFAGQPGPLNAITDVPGVAVGQTTLISGSGPLVEGHGPVRTGVTVIFPQGKDGTAAVAAGRAVINGTGEWTGMAVVDELGELFGPIALTGTGNLGVVHQALVDWSGRPGYLPPDARFWRLLPAVGETLDIALNDVFGHAMTRDHVFAALDSAKGGPVAEGNVGGGTGMTAYEFKGGIGTASRVFTVRGKAYTVGVLVQANNGKRKELRIAGVPIGEEITDLRPELDGKAAADPANPVEAKRSLLVVIATDAPLDGRQLARVARRAALGIGRVGSTAHDLSGEFALAFSTTNTFPVDGVREPRIPISDEDEAFLNPLFDATAEGVEEAIVNQLVASQTMQGANNAVVHGLPHDRLIKALKAHNRWTAPK
jgi:L-aminopeptidase/D-esterase-like protein